MVCRSANMSIQLEFCSGVLHISRKRGYDVINTNTRSKRHLLKHLNPPAQNTRQITKKFKFPFLMHVKHMFCLKYPFAEPKNWFTQNTLRLCCWIRRFHFVFYAVRLAFVRVCSVVLDGHVPRCVLCCWNKYFTSCSLSSHYGEGWKKKTLSDWTPQRQRDPFVKYNSYKNPPFFLSVWLENIL